MRRAMAELQELRGELDVDQAAGTIFQIPQPVAGELLGDAGAHVGHILGDLPRVAGLADDGADAALGPLHGSGRTRDGAGPGQRHMLPGPGALGLVAQESPEVEAIGPWLPDGRSRMSTS